MLKNSEQTKFLWVAQNFLLDLKHSPMKYRIKWIEEMRTTYMKNLKENL